MPVGLLLLVLVTLVGLPLLVALAIWRLRQRRDAAERQRPPQAPTAAAPRPWPHPELDELLVRVARAFEHPEHFNAAARAVAQQLPFERAALLVQRFHHNPPPPPDLAPALARHGVFGVWMEVCQNAIFQVLYHYRDHAIPLLFTIATGPRDWTRTKAVHVLLRLADDGVEATPIRQRLIALADATDDEDLRTVIREGVGGGPLVQR